MMADHDVSLDGITAGVFHFPDAERNPAPYCRTVCKYITENDGWNPNETDRRALLYVSDTLQNHTENPTLVSEKHIFIKWFPEYSCALLAKPFQGCMPTQMRSISLVGLDQWQVRAQETSVSADYKALSHGYAGVFIHNVPEEDFGRYLSCLNESLEARDPKEKKTPAYIEARCEDAKYMMLQPKGKKNSKTTQTKRHAPRRGWPDNDSSEIWSLVSAVVAQLISYSPSPSTLSPKALYELFSGHFRLWLLEKELHISIRLINDASSEHRVAASATDIIVRMLTCVARQGASVADKGYESHEFKERCVNIRRRLDQAATRRACNISQAYLLMSDELEDFSLPQMNLREYLVTDVSSNHSSKPMEIYLEDLPMLLHNTDKVPELSRVLKWIKSIDEKGHRELLLVLTTVESVIFHMATQLQEDHVADINVEELVKLVEQYRLRNDNYLKSLLIDEKQWCNSILKVEVMSKEVLVVWVSYCLIHKSTRKTVPLIENYGIPLRWQDVGYLVFSDKQALTVSHVVSDYIKKNSHGEPLFSLKIQGPSLQLAKRYALNSPELQEIWNREVADANNRIERHWDEIERKQRRVVAIEKELEEYTMTKQDLEEQVNRKIYEKDQYTFDRQTEEEFLEAKVSTVVSSIRYIENRLNAKNLEKGRLERELNAKRNTISTYTKHKSSEKSRIQSRIREKNAEAVSKKNALRTQLWQHENSLAEIEEKIRRSTADICHLNGCLERLECEEEEEEQRDDLECKIYEADTDKRILERELKETTVKMKHVNQELESVEENNKTEELESAMEEINYQLRIEQVSSAREVETLQKKIRDISRQIQEIQYGNELRDEKGKKEKLSKELEIMKTETKKKSNLLYEEIRKLRDSVSQTTGTIKNTKGILAKVRKPPPVIYQPLPVDRSIAAIFLFFLYMPRPIEILARFTIIAQQMILPGTDKLEYSGLDEHRLQAIIESTTVPESKLATALNTNYKGFSYYNKYSSYNSNACVIKLFSSEVPPERVGPYDVMDYNDKSQGIWYPDHLSLFMAWNGGDFTLGQRKGFFDPFKDVPSRDVSDSFTEKVDKKIQWVIPQYGKDTCSSRGNQPIAKQNLKPDRLRKVEWLELANLRAFPHCQLRNLCRVLGDRSLPLDDDLVMTAIRLLLYHTGDISDDGKMEWKGDLLFAEFGVGDVMLQELNDIAEEISNRNYRCLILLIEIGCYMSQWYPSCQSVCRRFVQILLSWVEELDEQIIQCKNTDPEDVIVDLRAKKALFCKYALSCYAKGSITQADAKEICKLIFLARDSVDLSKHSAYDDELKLLSRVCDHVISNRMFDILREVRADNFAMLTSAVREIIHDIPKVLSWEVVYTSNNNVDYASSCFQARSGNKLYSVNLSTGIILIDGQTISRLPSCIYKHPVYERTFGDRGFEISVSGDVYTTVMSVQGCIYSFKLKNNELEVHEIDMETRKDLQLLKNDDAWSNELPLRIRNQYSHWYCHERKSILVRDISFSERKTYFLIKMMEVAEESWKCFRIPSYRLKDIWEEFLNDELNVSGLDKLIINKQVNEKLEKFEDPKYIHVYLTPAGSIKAELPRFQLTFELTKGEDGRRHFKSGEFKDYALAECQQLNDTLMGFKRYLVLEHLVRGSDMKIIVPEGNVVIQENCVDVVGCERSDSGRNAIAYNIHPRLKYLEAPNVSSRLLLAELYTATSTLLPEGRMKITGEEVAMKLLRQCWTNRPMSESDYVRLRNVAKFSHNSPALELLCFEVENSSFICDFLFPDNPKPLLDFPREAANLYLQEAYPRNVKGVLTAGEEYRVLGRRYSQHEDPTVLTRNSNKGIAESNIKGVESYEEELKSLVVRETKEGMEFFLGGNNGETELQTVITKELRHSFMTYNEIPFINLNSDLQPQLQRLLPIRNEVSANRKSIESYLMDSINDVPNMNGQANAFRIRRAANISPMLKLEDMMIASHSVDYLRNFNPFLSQEDLTTLRAEILKWMELCVLEDKLYRLCHICNPAKPDEKEANEKMFIKEVCTFRTWSVDEHPEWLIFEVLNRLQIRPLQYSVANSIINGIEGKADPIVQLNMGEGKTRVIIPMLILHWRKSSQLIRLNFLSALIEEAIDYLSQNMCAGVMGIKFFTLPFSRDVFLTEQQAKAMHNVLEFCKDNRGILFVTPEHRLSLKLKWYELHRVGRKHENTYKSLEDIDRLPCIDILDECDEILRIKQKLIYACGSHLQLKSGEIRWKVAQTLLKIIKENSKVQECLSLFAQWKLNVTGNSESFREFRIVDGDVFQDHKQAFYEGLFDGLLDNLPHELRYVKGLKQKFPWVVDYVTNPDADVENLKLAGGKNVSDVILSLRGYLANGLLVHCLKKRNRVEYGVKHGEKKRMAVPFLACETPTPRAEFSHHDCAILYSLLAYYYDGLTGTQVSDSFRVLLSYGSTRRDTMYEEWYKLSESSINESSCNEKLNHATKIDISDKTTVRLLVQHYRYNMEVINFWLETFVFPTETLQYPNRLEATAWDTVSTKVGQSVTGFSGTNDEKILLPSTLSWVKQEEAELNATDGKMLQLIAKNARFRPFDQFSSREGVQWKRVLDEIIKLCRESSHLISALIDAGALMAGAPSNEAIATYLLDKIDPSIYKGVVYFDKAGSGWHILDNLGRNCSKNISPIHERDAFVVFDESRCRGADMKLRMNSTAVLTLGPNMCKDKLMQAAGRMRQLEHSQKVVMMALPDVTTKIREVNYLEGSTPITPIQVLKWTLYNTFTSVAKWLPEWAIQGSHHAIKQGRPELAFLSEESDLNHMYGTSVTEQLITSLWQHQKATMSTSLTILPAEADEIIKNIDDRIGKFGSDSYTVFSNLEGECERELEKEVEIDAETEVEKEVERQLPARNARKEIEWNTTVLFRTDDLVISPVVLNRLTGVKVIPLASFVHDNLHYEGLPLSLYDGQISWPSNIYGTENFFYTCVNQHGFESLNHYLRLVNSCLIFPCGGILLLSEREYDTILASSWYHTPKCTLLNLTWARRYSKREPVIRLKIPFDFKVNIGEEEIAALQLFAGEVTFDTQDRRNAVSAILSEPMAKNTAPMFSAIRGLSDRYPRSHLEDLCNDFT